MSFSNFREISELKPVKLNDVIEKNPKSDYGFFNDIANDLSKFSDDERTPDNIFIPLYYALRIAAAGMYAQGLMTDETVEIIKTIFINRCKVINLRATEEEAIKFQNESYEEAIKFQNESYEEAIKFQNESYEEAIRWLNENYIEIDVETAFALVKAAEDGKSQLKKQLNAPEDAILTAEFCLDFYKKIARKAAQRD